MNNENRFIGIADEIAGSGAASLRSPEAQSSYFMERAKVEAITQNTKAVEDLKKSIDTLSMGLVGELMSLKETLNSCLEKTSSTTKEKKS